MFNSFCNLVYLKKKTHTEGYMVYYSYLFIYFIILFWE